MLRSLDDEFDIAVDSELREVKVNVPNPNWSQLPDPFGHDWSWLTNCRHTDMADQAARAEKDKQALPLERRSSTRERAIWIFALAASLLMGLFIFNPGDSKELALLQASGDISVAPVRGEQPRQQLTILGPFDGFAAVISLFSDRKPQVFPVLGGDDIDIQEDRVSNAILLPVDTQEVLFVVTRTPAGEEVRRIVKEADFPGDGISGLEQFKIHLEEQLATKGFRQLAIGTIKLASESK